MKQPIHLGDGAYVSEGFYPGEVILTTGSHNPADADNYIALDPNGIRLLLEWLNVNGEGVKPQES